MPRRMARCTPRWGKGTEQWPRGRGLLREQVQALFPIISIVREDWGVGIKR